MEVRAGFEPANNGFADHPLGPLGYRTEIGIIEKDSTKVLGLPDAALRAINLVDGFGDGFGDAPSLSFELSYNRLVTGRHGAARVLIAILVLLSTVAARAQALKIGGMHVNAYGDPRNQPIVFVHGGPGYNSWDFEFTTARPLSEQGYYVVVYDQRGQGRSDAADSKGFDYRQYADDLKEIIDGLKLKEPVLIGHSHGGPITIKFDEFYPHVAKKIILVESGSPVPDRPRGVPRCFRRSTAGIPKSAQRDMWPQSGELAK